MDTTGRFFAFFDTGDNFCDFLCFPVLQQSPPEKGSNIKGKNLLPWEQILSFHRRPLFRRETK